MLFTEMIIWIILLIIFNCLFINSIVDSSFEFNDDDDDRESCCIIVVVKKSGAFHFETISRDDDKWMHSFDEHTEL